MTNTEFLEHLGLLAAILMADFVLLVIGYLAVEFAVYARKRWRE